jgi:O-antigen ligase
MTAAVRYRSPALLGAWAAAVAVIPGTPAKALVAAPPVLAGIACWIVARPERWIGLLFFSLILLPPVPAPFGDAGAHVAPLLALAGVLCGILRMNEWRPLRGSLPILLGIFAVMLLGSSGFALLYSGPIVAAGSVARVVLFGIGVYLFLYTLAGPRNAGASPFALVRPLFAIATAGAVFACIDFYYQLPAPAGFEPQFVWLDQGVFRRAQGLFYEASTLGNFCAFFLVMILVAFFCPREKRPISRPALAVATVFFAAALIVSYSRASLINLLMACLAFLFVRRVPVRRFIVPGILAVPLVALIVGFTVPAFFAHYWTRLAASFQYFYSAPDRVLSGRLASWAVITDFLSRHPWQTVFGIGYKTLPYSQYVGAGVVADNTYLSLLVETGVVGLALFLLLNASILYTAWRAARSRRSEASFFGAWIFCFWVGELVQMLSGDLITYWRVLPIYFWVLAMAARETTA